MEKENSLSARTLAQIVLMQGMVAHLPDMEQIMRFVCRGLVDVPGVADVRYRIFSENEATPGAPEGDPGSTRTITMKLGGVIHGELLFMLSDEGAFSLYLPFIENLVHLLSVVFEERRQRRLNIELLENLEQNVYERTKELELEIQEHKRAEEALRESKERYQSIFENVQDVFYEATLDGTIREVSPSITQLSGGQYHREELIGTSLYDIYYHPREQDVLVAVLQDRGSVTDYEINLKNKDGAIIPCAISSKIRFDPREGAAIIVGSMRDISERKRSEQRLAEEREQLSVTLRSIGDGVISTDMEGRIVLLNKAAESMTGWRAEDALGRPLPEVFTILNEITRVPCENPVEKVLKTGAVVELANHTCLISKDGREIVIADSGAPIRNKESRITGVVLVFRDMTEKQKLNDAMQRAQRLESLGILAGGIAHDFNNLLAGMFGYLDLIKENVTDTTGEQIPKYLEKALGVFDRARGLTQQLLTFSKGGAPVRKTMPLAPLIQHSAHFALSGSNVSCQFDLAEGLWMVECDANQIGQVVDNIIINAMQAMPSGGKIVLTGVNVDEIADHPGRFVRISIKDEGMGIPQEILPKIFDPFFSTKTTGHGLGLATVFSIIKQHDGWIEVESAFGKGTTFHLFLPASQKVEFSATDHVSARHVGTGTILVMDDENFMLEIVGAMLHGMGYTVVLAKNGQEALALFMDAERSGTPVVAAILDLTIPGGLGGKEVAGAIRKIDPNALIIASSGYSEDPIISNPLAHGFTDKIVKPYRKNELMELMTRIMKQHTTQHRIQ